ncbi:alkaline phosphatase D family protein [Sorangium sp. So ce1389]|uniref:alkaline phosphatase D family protein n=1 Tax=Sorangium sp. So ce1389 TaxID=3133336 RepID=UPI003F645F0F
MMRRRDFLRATLVTAGSVVVPTACSEEEGMTGACDVNEDDTFFPQSVASGDPRPESVVLWTRLVDGDGKTDLNLALVVALDEAFTQLVELRLTSSTVAATGSGGTRVPVTARAEFDHCVKVKVNGLSPGTTYYYRFYYTTGNGCFSSRVGRTRTAPAPDADVPVRFAFVSCQDYLGRFYNAYAALARQEIDFVVHLGDYIYETTGDPSSQTPSQERTIAFSDVEGAIALEADDIEFHAARSLSNYRELYRTYRADRALQRVHERFPMIATWSDHEFSDDCHGATATYLDGQGAERGDEDRRKAANQAWFEYMPVDYRAGDDFQYSTAAKHPDDITIYRDFTFGKHVHLVMTDLRSYRADHLIPEDAFPGKVVVNEASLVEKFGAVTPPFASPYIPDIDAEQHRIYREMFEEIAPTFGFDPSLGYGPSERPRIISATFVNTIVAKLNEQREEQLPLIGKNEMAFFERGISYFDLGKTDYLSKFGSRYFVIKDAFDAVSDLAEDAPVMGDAQSAWFKDTIEKSESTWKVWGNEYCLSQLIIDNTIPSSEEPPPEDPPPPPRFYMSCDGWDGFRKERNDILGTLAAQSNVVAITGDLHAFVAGTPAGDTSSSMNIVEFVVAAISSATYRSLLRKQVAAHPILKDVPQSANIADNIEKLLVESATADGATVRNPRLAFCKAASNGFCVAEANADEFVVTMHMLPDSALAAPLYEEADEAALKEQITTERFKTVAGTRDLYREEGGKWKKWNPEAADWDA